MRRFFSKFVRIFKQLVGRVFINPDKPLPPPLPNPIDWVMFRYFPRWRKSLTGWHLSRAVAATKENYVRQLERIHAKFQSGEKIRVMFIVKELAKWKASSLYKAMKQSSIFKPVIGLTHPLVIHGVIPRETEKAIKRTKDWFELRGYECCVIYDSVRDKVLDLESFSPDIVFYPEVWYNNRIHSPIRVSQFALTCYIPYFVPNYVSVDLDCRQDMHRLYWRHFVLNGDLVKLYRDSTSDRTMAGEFVGLGHTMFDTIAERVKELGTMLHPRRVIYAPHWTFDHPKNFCPVCYSTFPQLGEKILAYAKQHREFEWVFKPHPALRDRIVSTGLMSPREIDDYYDEWRRIGEVCLSADYDGLFADSMAMITDCGSFLSEYGATGHPIIHLLSQRNKEVPPEGIRKLYDTYYQVHDEKELFMWLAKILEKGCDPNKKERSQALERVDFCGQNAAKNIVEYLSQTLGFEHIQAF